MLIHITIICLALITYWFFEDRRKHKGFPPGPIRFPIIGNIPAFILKRNCADPVELFQELAREYGDIMFISVGNVKAVFVHKFDLIMEILCHDKAVDRAALKNPILYDRQAGKNLGIILADGDSWDALRRFTHRTLRDYGFEKMQTMEFLIDEELNKFVKHIDSLLDSSPDGVFQFRGFFEIAITNILWRLVTGRCFEFDDPNTLYLLEMHNEFSNSSSYVTDPSLVFPVLRDWFPKFFRRDETKRSIQKMHDFARKTIREHRSQGTYATEPRGFIDRFLQKIDENKDVADSPFNDDQLMMMIIDLFEAAADTTSKTLEFAVLYMILFPEVFKKVQMEIDSVIPDRNERITLSHKAQLPYCHSTLLELHRYCSMLPFPPNRAATEDFYFHGYLIKKGTLLIVNTKSAHFDKDIWGDPENFRPERFLLPDGTVNNKLAEFVIPFGAGKRVCVGANVANTELFLTVTTLCRNFNFLRAPGKPEPSLEQIFGFSNMPKPFHGKIVRRQTS